MISIEEAKRLIHTHLFEPHKIVVDLEQSQNTFLAENIFADRDYPPFNRAAVDGYVVRFSDMDSGLKNFRVAAVIFSGEKFEQNVEPGRCVKIMTGAAVPEGFDVLFKVEHCEETAGVVAVPEEEISRWLNISRQGENAHKGDVILKQGTKIDERVVHSLAATGIHSVPVFKTPRVNIISTGNEIIPVQSNPDDCQIRDSNYYGLLFHLAKLQIKPEKYSIVKDDPENLKREISSALDCDVLIVSGGVSMGDRDYIPEFMDELGVDMVFHNVNIKPGKPLWYGRRHFIDNRNKTFVFALPGNPLSTLVSYKIFIEPWLYASLGNQGPQKMYLPLEREKVLKGERPEYFPVKIVSRPGEISTLDPLRFHGSGNITATAGSDGLAFHPAGKRELYKGELVEFISWN